MWCGAVGRSYTMTLSPEVKVSVPDVDSLGHSDGKNTLPSKEKL